MPQTVTENGSITTTLYNSVTIDVPNTYTAEDEGKVVSNNELVVQTARETEITENGTYDTTLNNSITVNVSAPAPTPGTRSGAVIRDYDGSVIASYTPAQFAALSAYPAQPVHTGLTGQGYNWSLAGAKAYVAKYGYVEVGATYITDDGKTRLYIIIADTSYGVTFDMEVDGTITVDWNDGSEPDVETGYEFDPVQFSHNYSSTGKYIITINVAEEGSAGFTTTAFSRYADLYKVEFGSGITSITSTFFDCSSLYSVTLSNNVEMLQDNYLNHGAFMGCTSLSTVVIPENCSIYESTFSDCSALTCIVLPVMSDIPDSCFSGCSALTSTSMEISGITTIGIDAFNQCKALNTFTIPEDVTRIESGTWFGCTALTSIVIPEAVIYINSGAFDSCYSLTSVKFISSTPAEINGDLSNDVLNPFCIIYVPQGTLEAYTTAENYPDPTIYTYIEY